VQGAAITHAIGAWRPGHSRAYPGTMTNIDNR
jgi:hypothetical protein